MQMKKELLMLAAAVLFTLPASANAAIVVEEQFIYNAGVLLNSQSGSGFGGAWVQTKYGSRDFLIKEPGLTFIDTNSSELPVAGNSVYHSGSAGRAEVHRPISGASRVLLTGDETTIWFSVLFQAPSAYRQAPFLFGTGAFTTNDPVELSAAGEGFGFTLGIAGGYGTGTINALAFDDSTAPTVVVSTFNQAQHPL